ncbi:biopolymer transporter Tol [Tundrisphaera lichenicola]|uniref:TolB family protein n=1 Tax=Tundrisphaera lichenicola TaxID=2029860 RepID=UPI003EB6D858
MPWSPDGTWLAYSVEVRPIGSILKPGWLFESPGGATRPTSGPIPGSAPTGYRLWATRPDTDRSVLLEESIGPLTAPGWSPDGRALAFGRVVPEEKGPGRLEVVILEGPTRRRVIFSRALPTPQGGGGAASLPGQAIAWSPDGRYLAVPQLGPDGLAIIRADNGRQVNSIPDAFLPSWSPDGGRLAFYVRGTSDTLHCIDSALGQSRPLVEVGHAGQAPAWTRDGLSVLVLARLPIAGEVNVQGDQARMLRVRVDGGLVESVKFPAIDELILDRDRSSEGFSVALDREGENLFCSGVVEGQPNQVTWFRPREGSVYKKFSLLDHGVPMGSLSLSPDGRILAARVGPIDRLSAPALCDLESPDLRSRLIAPDDESRVEWIATLVQAARLILANLPPASLEPSNPSARRIERPTLLPVLGEFEGNSEPTFRLRRIGRMGRPLCNRPEDAPAASAELREILDEARLFFDYLQEDYSAALKSLEALEGQAATPERRFRLLGVRAQIYLAQGRVEQAGRTIAYLKDRERKPSLRIEATGAGYALSPELDSFQGWPEYLETRALVIRAILHDEPLEPHFNPDAPRPMSPFDAPELNLNQIFRDPPGRDAPNLPGGFNPGGNQPRIPIPREFPAGIPR